MLAQGDEDAFQMAAGVCELPSRDFREDRIEDLRLLLPEEVDGALEVHPRTSEGWNTKNVGELVTEGIVKVERE